MQELPRGTVTLLFTDIEGSTRLLRTLGREKYVVALETHRHLLRQAADRHGGVEVETQGDSFLFAFPSARDAAVAASEGQQALANHAWDDLPITVRMGLHTGEPTISESKYAGLDVHRAARVMSVASGGQVLLSARTTDLITGELSETLSVRRLGTYVLKDFDGGEPLAQLVIAGMPSTFPPPRAERLPSRLTRAVPRPVRRHPRVATAGILVLAAAVALPLALIHSAPPRLQADSLAELDATSGKILASVPVGDTPAAVVALPGTLWVANSGDATLSKVDTRQARVVHTIPLPGTPVGIAQGNGSLWVLNTDLAAAHSSVTRVDLQYERVTTTIDLPNSILIGSGAGITWDGRDIWAVTQAGSAFRIDGRSNRITSRVPVGEDPISLVAAGGSIWVANRRNNSVSRIQPPATVTDTIGVGAGPSAIAAAAGSVWVADTGENTVRRLDARTGSVLTTVKVGRAPSAIAASAHSVWVANADDLDVMRIDPRTNRVVKKVKLDYPPVAVSVAGGHVWIALQRPRRPAPPVSAQARTLRLITGNAGVIDSVDPPLAYTIITWNIEYATCAKLVNYPDKAAPEGYKVRPEIATSLPAVSNGGRTYTFTIRPGYRFSPPSNQAVNARTFAYTIERALAPGTKSLGVGFFSDIVGALDYEQGKARHISGVVARGDKLVITLVQPSGDLTARLAMPFLCPVPIGTPVDFKGLAGIPSAGPYYVASYTPGKDVLLRANPNYHGIRPHSVATIDIRQVASQDAALAMVEKNEADAVIDLGGSTQVPAKYRSTFRRYPTPTIHYLALNTSRPTFRSAKVRRAVAIALDRKALTRFNPSLVAVEGLLPPDFPGQRARPAYSTSGNVAAARRLLGGAKRTVTYVTCNHASCIQEATLVARQLAGIGIHVIVKPLALDPLFAEVTKPGAAFDITDSGWAMDYVDPADFLVPLMTASGIKPAQSTNTAYFRSPANEQAFRRAIPLAGEARLRAFASLEWALRTRDVPYIAIATETRPVLFGTRVGCMVNNPVYGLDLGSLCIRQRD